MNKTKIDWADVTWQIVTGCTPISEGCQNCYARTLAETRLRGRAGFPEVDPFQVIFHADRLQEPLHSKKPRNVFVASMGDLFHENISFEQLNSVFGVMEDALQHNYLLLTKRSQRLMEYVHAIVESESDESVGMYFSFPDNIWLGVTVENDKHLDRIEDLIATGHKNLFVSLEPLLGPIDITPYLPHLKWVIVGAESGPGRRECRYYWVDKIIGDCILADVPVFYKQGPDDEGKWCKEPMLGRHQWLQFPEGLKR